MNARAAREACDWRRTAVTTSSRTLSGGLLELLVPAHAAQICASAVRQQGTPRPSMGLT
jgi:hypothetical protein